MSTLTDCATSTPCQPPPPTAVHRQKSYISPVSVLITRPLPHSPPEPLQMEQVLRFNNTDQRITYSDGWETTSSSGVGQNETYPLTSTISAQFFFLFRGIVHT